MAVLPSVAYQQSQGSSKTKPRRTKWLLASLASLASHSFGVGRVWGHRCRNDCFVQEVEESTNDAADLSCKDKRWS